MNKKAVALIEAHDWAILPKHLDALQFAADADVHVDDIKEVFLGEAPVERASIDELIKMLSKGDEDVRDATAVIPLHGTIISRAPSWARFFGATSPQDFAKSVKDAADDPAVERIILDIDSPGGTVAGTSEAAAAVKYAQNVKPVVSVANGMMASAAYWIGSQAGKIIGTDTSQVGSIGVIMTHRDLTRAEEMFGQKTTYIRSSPDKADGQPFEPLSEEARARMKAHVDALASVFRSAVSEGRGVPVSQIENDWTAKVFIGADAVDAGLIDEIGTLDSVIASLVSEDTTMTDHELSNAQGEHEDAFAETPEHDAPEADAPLGDDTSAADSQEGSDNASDVEAALARAAKAERALLEHDAEALVKEAIATGRANPAQKDALFQAALKDIDFVRDFIGRLPAGTVTPVGGERLTPRGPVTKSGEGHDYVGEFLGAQEEANIKFENPLFKSRGRA